MSRCRRWRSARRSARWRRRISAPAVGPRRADHARRAALNLAMTGALVALVVLFDRHAARAVPARPGAALPIAQPISLIATWSFMLFGGDDGAVRRRARERRGDGAAAHPVRRDVPGPARARGAAAAAAGRGRLLVELSRRLERDAGDGGALLSLRPLAARPAARPCREAAEERASPSRRRRRSRRQRCTPAAAEASSRPPAPSPRSRRRAIVAVTGVFASTSPSIEIGIARLGGDAAASGRGTRAPRSWRAGRRSTLAAQLATSRRFTWPTTAWTTISPESTSADLDHLGAAMERPVGDAHLDDAQPLGRSPFADDQRERLEAQELPRRPAEIAEPPDHLLQPVRYRLGDLRSDAQGRAIAVIIARRSCPDRSAAARPWPAPRPRPAGRAGCPASARSCWRFRTAARPGSRHCRRADRPAR